MRKWFMLLVSLVLSTFATSEQMVYQPGPSQGKDGYFRFKWDGSQTVIYPNSSFLRIGTSPDYLRSAFIDFDLDGLPKHADKVVLKMVCTKLKDVPVSTSPFDAWIIKDDWEEVDGPYTLWSNPSELPAPTPVRWVGYNITGLYNAMQAGGNYNGLYFFPTVIDDAEIVFRSSDYPTAKYRPKLVITYTPETPASDFKMPLPAGKSWLLTTEVGGSDCFSGSIDEFHTNENYFSLDFSPKTSDGVTQSNVPILSSANGYVVEVGYNDFNGYYIAINHTYTPNDTENFKRDKGLVSFYLHFDSPSPLVKGSRVYQGTILGTMGNTGISTGRHLHIGFKYDGLGIGQNQLSSIKMENLFLDQYDTVCQNGNRVGYYYSTNTPR